MRKLEEEVQRETSAERCRRKRDQAFEMAGLARMDADEADARRRTKEAALWDARLKEITQ